MKSGKAQPTRRVPADGPVKVSTMPTKGPRPTVPPSHGNGETRSPGAGTGVRGTKEPKQ
jgi:hypothetical protein